VVSAIAQALGVKEPRDQTLEESLAAYLRHRHMLLLLDNFEQLLAAAPLVAELLSAAPRVKALVTSRAALRLSFEREFPVSPLALPLSAPHAQLSVEELLQYPAARLFVERAQAVQPGFVPRIEDAPAVAEICRRLDGLPLAIELAAARSKLFAPPALLARLTSRLGVLTNGMRDLPARQQTLRDAIAWSYDLLGAVEQALFRRLGVFVGGCTIEAAEAVCTGDGGAAPTASSQLPAPVLDVLASLVDKSLLSQREGADHEPRFDMLETIREYALERLAELGEAADQCRRHAAYYLNLAEAAQPQLQGGQQVAWLDRLEAEHDNLRAALEWLLETGDAEAALRLSGALWLFWQVRGYFTEGIGWFGRALEQAGASHRTLARAKALNGAGFLTLYRYDTDRAVTLVEESLAIARELEDGAEIAHALNNLGTIAIDQCDYERALAYCTESLALARELGMTWLSGWALMSMGRVALERRDTRRASDLLEESLALFRSIEGKRGMAFALMMQGYVALHENAIQRAMELLKAGLALVRELKDTYGIIYTTADLAQVARHQGLPDKAIELIAESLALSREQEDRPAITLALLTSGQLLVDQGAYEQANAMLKEGLTLAIEQDDALLIALGLIGLASVRVKQERPDQAARLLGACEALCEAKNVYLNDVEQADYDTAVSSLRADLDQEALAAAWALGRAMSPQQALAEP
jgi:predicted ATPase